MNLSGLFETQAALDARIYESHPELKGQDNLGWKVLALQVELGECANEWRRFKKWSNDQEPRVRKACTFCNGSGVINFVDHKVPCRRCKGSGTVGNPLLEEYVDCLHFILSIGLEFDDYPLDMHYEVLGFRKEYWNNKYTIEQFQVVFKNIADFSSAHDELEYIELVSQFLGLGEMLGFDWEQVEQAYYAKNEVNHQRQESGY